MATDYRCSHLEKGEDYDRELSAGDFNTYMTQREIALLRRIVPRLFPQGVPRYLDFACGTGRITAAVAPFAQQSVGIDVSASMVAQAREKCPSTTFILTDVTVEAPPVEPFDLITAFRFFGNAGDELRGSVLRALYDMLAPGGYLILNNHRNPGAIISRLARVRGTEERLDLSVQKLRGLLADSGFAVVRAHAIAAWVVRAKLSTPEVLASPIARALESASRLPLIHHLAPDMVVVARKDQTRRR